MYPILEYEVSHNKLDPDISAETSKEYQWLQKQPFWCRDTKLHLEDPDNYHLKGCCFNHSIGLPQHPADKKPMPLTPYQVDFTDKVMEARRKANLLTPPGPVKIHLNKGRQMGFTEIVLRYQFYQVFHGYAGWKIGIIAATNGKLAYKNLRRFHHLTKRIPWILEDKFRGTTLSFVNGTTAEAFPATEEAITGDTKYACILMDEAAKWRTLDDLPIFNSIIPIINTNAADLFLVSTPKGKRKMFYAIEKDPGEYIKLKYDIWEAMGNMYTRQQIEKILTQSKEDPDQEYLCKFTEGRNAVFGDITSEMRDDDLFEWGEEPIQVDTGGGDSNGF